MTDTHTNAPPAAGGQPPAGGAAPPAPPSGGSPQPLAPARPDFLPETYWDPQGGIKPEFGPHYTEVAAFHKTETEKQAALKARKPDDIKLELKLPDTVKVPEGMSIKIDDKDPRIPVIRQLALDHGLDQEVVNKLVALDAQQKIEAHNAEVARVVAEDAKLGANGKTRKDAISSWIGTLGMTADEAAELRLTGTTAAGVIALEKVMAKVNGTIPGAQPPAPPPPPAPKTLAEKMWPQMAAQGKAS